MHDINYDRRNEWYSNNEYDLQRLVGKKYLGMEYDIRGEGKRMYVGVDAYEIFLKWEGYIMSYIAPVAPMIPKKLNKYIGCRLEDWDAMPNHAAQMFILYFEGAKDEVSFNTFRYVHWEIVD